MVKSHLNSLQHDFLAENEGVVSVFESRMNRLHTTHSWKFLGIDSIPQYSNLPMDIKSDVIVGVLDTGTQLVTYSTSLLRYYGMKSLLVASRNVGGQL